MCDHHQELQLDRYLKVGGHPTQNPGQLKPLCLAFLQGLQKIQHRWYVLSETIPYTYI